MEKRVSFILLLLCAILFGSFVIARAVGQHEFVRGETGAKCYIVGSEHGNITRPIYFPTFEECQCSLPQNRDTLKCLEYKK